MQGARSILAVGRIALLAAWIALAGAHHLGDAQRIGAGGLKLREVDRSGVPIAVGVTPRSRRSIRAVTYCHHCRQPFEEFKAI